MSLRAKRGNLDCGSGIERRPPASAGRLRQTNPISGGRHTPLLYCSIIPPFQPDADCTNKAKPGHPGISGEPDAGRRANAPNKPNFCAGDLEDKCRADKELQPMGCTSGLGKTKPILSLRIADFGLRIVGQTCRLRPAQGDCAKQTEFPGHGRSRPWYSWAEPALSEAEGTPMLRNALRRHCEQGFCANKPNFWPGKMKGKCCANKELRQVGCGSGPGKTKPIRSGGGYQGSGFSGPRPGARTLGRLYKQSQLGMSFKFEACRVMPDAI